MSDTDEARGADEIKKPRVAECMYHTFLSCASFDCFVLDPGIRLDRVQAQAQPPRVSLSQSQSSEKKFEEVEDGLAKRNGLLRRGGVD